MKLSGRRLRDFTVVDGRHCCKVLSCGKWQVATDKWHELAVMNVIAAGGAIIVME